MVTSESTVRIASRGSQLALWQAETVQKRLADANPGLTVEIEIVKTTGDKILDVPLAKIGDKGLFTKEIDEALLDGRANVAVHSLKDVPTRVPEGLVLAAIGEREDPRDVVIGRASSRSTLQELKPGARVGTSSLRRRAQLRRLRPDLEVLDLRGNLNTRLAKLDAGEYEAIILAAAGVIRLGWEDRITHFLEPMEWLPAVGQGALAIVTRADDLATNVLVRALHDPTAALCVSAERAFLRALEGGCQIPIGALARVDGSLLLLDGLVADVEGEEILRDQLSGDITAAEEVGRRLAARLIEGGAERILAAIRNAPPVPAP